MRILHGLGFEGISAFTCNLMAHLDMSQFDVTIIMAVDKNGVLQKREKEVADCGVKILRTCDLGSISRLQTHLHMLKEILVKEGPFNVIHSNMDKLNGLNLKVAKELRIPKRISHSHCANRVKYINPLKDMIATIYQKFMFSMIKWYATDFVGCSDLANNYMHNGKGDVVVNGIALNKFYRNIKQSSPLFEAKAKVLGVVARVSPPKNPFYFIGIVRELSRIRQDFTLVWIGDSNANLLLDQIKLNGLEKYFNFLGQRNDVADLLQYIDVFLMPSLFEGLPISAVEAQASGCECLLSDNITRMVDVGLFSFLPIGEGNEGLWAEKINELLNKKRTKLPIEKLKVFDVQTMADSMSDIYMRKYDTKI